MNLGKKPQKYLKNLGVKILGNLEQKSPKCGKLRGIVMWGAISKNGLKLNIFARS